MADETIVWVTPTGEAHRLTDPPLINLEMGRTGLYLPPTEIQKITIPGRPGAKKVGVKVGVRDITLPLLISGDTREQARSRFREIAGWFNPLLQADADGRLQFTTEDGLTREIAVTYMGGFEGLEDPTHWGREWMRFVAMFEATWPYFQDVSASSLQFQIGSLTPFLKTPFFPMTLSSSSITNLVLVSNIGDGDAWPIWTITGPGDTITLTNQSTGKTFSYNAAITAGQILTVDTREDYKSVATQDGVNRFGNTTGELWSLRPGDNNIQLIITGATVATTILLRWWHSYLTI